MFVRGWRMPADVEALPLALLHAPLGGVELWRDFPALETRVWFDPSFADCSLDAWLPQVRCPLLALHGDRNPYGSTAFPERIAGGVCGPAQPAVLDDCGHVPHREQPERVLVRAAHFMASVAAP